MQAFPEQNSHGGRRLQPRGGALAGVLILCLTLAIASAMFVGVITASLSGAREYNAQAGADAAVRSAIEHAKGLLHADLLANAADSPQDVWVTGPSGDRVLTRAEWTAYAASPGALDGQRWFELPGTRDGEMVRYRMKLVDAQPAARSVEGVQPLVAAAWRNGRWVPSDDLNAADAEQIAGLIARFDDRATNAGWCAAAAARLADARDDNMRLARPDDPGSTEPLRFERFVTDVDTRWCHFDDTLRLGRYYEERLSHNFFLIKESRLWYNSGLGRSNVVATLEREPVSAIPGWEAFTRMRGEAGLPRWYEGMWNGLIAKTGSGALFKAQPVISNSQDALYFDDDNLERFKPGQTVTFAGWFSSISELARSRFRAAQPAGAFVTMTNWAPDCVLVTNVGREAQYRMTLLTGQARTQPLPVEYGFFGMNELLPARCGLDGRAVMRNGAPIEARQFSHGGFIEMSFRAPRTGVGATAPFRIEGLLLEQPEFITIRNDAAVPVCVRGWRLGYQCGERVFWTEPFLTSSYYHASLGRIRRDLSPSIPPRGSLIITPDAALFDWFAGANADGTWGNARGEQAPVVDVGWQSWSPAFRVARATAGRVVELEDHGGRRAAWETEWRLALPEADWAGAGVAGETVWLDPDGPDGPDAAVAGTVSDETQTGLAVVFAGTRERFNIGREATLRFSGLPRAVRRYWLVDAHGGVACVARFARQARRDAGGGPVQRVIRPDGSEERSALSWPAVRGAVRNRRSDDAAASFNGLFPSQTAKRDALRALDISDAGDWYMAEAAQLPFGAAVIGASAGVRCAADTVTIRRYESGALLWEQPGPELPAGEPGLLFREMHLPGARSVAVRLVHANGFSLCATPGLSITQLVGQSVRLGPSPWTSGVHVFGPQGSVVFEWTNAPALDQPARLTLSGTGVRAWECPATLSAWQQSTADAVRISVEVWHPRRLAYEPLVTAAAFDCSDRLSCGMVSPAHIDRGSIRLKVTTHRQLSRDAAALWLGAAFIHPVSPRDRVNVNTASPRVIAALCAGDPAARRELLGVAGSRGPFGSCSQLADALAAAGSAGGASILSVRSDVFNAEIEAEAVRRSGTNVTVLARRTLRCELDRSQSRLGPRRAVLARVRETHAASPPCAEGEAPVTLQQPHHPRSNR